MNLDHLWTFYCIGKARGVAAGRRSMPYRVELPSVSKHLSALEDYFGGKLCERRPFKLTPAGERLFLYAQSIFEEMPAVENEVKVLMEKRQLRVGASDLVLRDYLRPIFDEMRAKYGDFRLTLRPGNQPELEEMLRGREIDVALTVLDSENAAEQGGNPSSLSSPLRPGRRDEAAAAKSSKEFCLQKLFQFPLALLVPTGSKLKSIEKLTGDETLLCLPESHLITRNFQAGMKRRGLEDFRIMEVGSMETIEAYVRNGYGIGVSVNFRGLEKTKGFRVLPLPDFEPVTFGVMWQDSPNELVSAFIELVKKTKI